VVRRAVDDLGDSPPGTASASSSRLACSVREERVKRRSQGGFEESELGFLMPSTPNSPVELLERAVAAEAK
jgi:hypothetical protein